MQPQIIEQGVGGAVRQVQQGQQFKPRIQPVPPMNEAQLLRAQVAELQRQLKEKEIAPPPEKTYSFPQVQILRAADTIQTIIEEYDLSPTKLKNMVLARVYLLRMGNLMEFMEAPQQEEEQQPGMEDEEAAEMAAAGDGSAFFEGEDGASNVGGNLEQYEGTADDDMKTEIGKIHTKMARLRQDEKVNEKEKEKTGFDKIKGFLANMKKPKPDKDKRPLKSTHADLPETVG